MVGREEELATLRDRVARRRATIVLGAAGLGKTTLLAATAEPTPSASGTCVPLLSSRAFHVVEQALGEPAPPGEVQTVAAWARDRLDGRLLVLDDLHWADDHTLALIPYLVRTVPLLLAARPGEERTGLVFETVDVAGVDSLRLEPLAPAAARALVAARRPGLSVADQARVVAGAAGNPLLLERLDPTGESPPDLREALRDQISHLDPPVLRELARLGAYGRPVRPMDRRALLGLLDRGLAVDAEGLARPTHHVLGEEALALLPEAERRSLHADIARAVADPWEAAQHFHRAEELLAAGENAIRAADASGRPGEQAGFLAFATECAGEAATEALRLRTAGALVQAGDSRQALAVSHPVAIDEPERALIRAEALASLERFDEARACAAAGLELVRGSDTELEVRMLLAAARCGAWAYRDTGAAFAKEACEVASRIGAALTEARLALGLARFYEGDGACREQLAGARAAARTEGKPALECEAIVLHARSLRAFGDSAAALAACEEADELISMVALGAHVAELQYLHAHISLRLRGRFDEAVADYLGFTTDPALTPRHHDGAKADWAIALAEIGRPEGAQRLLEVSLAAPEAPEGERFLAAAGVELAWLREDHDAVRTLAASCTGLFASAARAALAWSAYETGTPQPPPAAESPYPVFAGAGLERDAVACLAGDPEAAVARFDAAEAAWARSEIRFALRCAWGAGEAARLAGDTETAINRLRSVEDRARAAGSRGLDPRLHRSLRALGVEPAPSPPPPAPVTEREREVAALFGAGLGAQEIARTLGVSEPVVHDLLAQTMRKVIS